MRICSALVLALVIGGLVGCAFADALFGVDSETGEDKPGASPIETAGGLLGLVFPWAAAGVASAKAVYDNVRKRKYAAGIKLTVDGADELYTKADSNGDGKVSKDELKAFLKLDSLKALIGKK